MLRLPILRVARLLDVGNLLSGGLVLVLVLLRLTYGFLPVFVANLGDSSTMFFMRAVLVVQDT